MDPRRFDRLATELGSRRALMGGAATLAATVAGSIFVEDAIARKKQKRKNKRKCKSCCRENGQPCNTKGNSCQNGFCLGVSFSVEAVWASTNEHDTFVFVPNQAGAALPFPFIEAGCTPEFSNCENDVYPFICVSQDAQGPGDEVTTVRTLLPGTYEYWIELDTPAAAGELTVTLRRANGSVMRAWSSPAIPSLNTQIGWHVFDVDGATASMTSVDQTIGTFLPTGAHNPTRGVCP